MLDIPTPEQYLLHGTGPKGTVCLLLSKENGIGDDVCALPAVSALAKENAVTVYTLHPDLWRGIGVTVVGVASDSETCDNGEYLDLLWDEQHLPLFEKIYKLSRWAIWEENHLGFHLRSRFEVLAEILGVELPAEFDFWAALNAPRPHPLQRVAKEHQNNYTLLSIESNTVFRSVPESVAVEMYEGLSHYEPVTWIGQQIYFANKNIQACSDIPSLVKLIAEATRIVGIDNGVMHLACALGKPATIMGGLTDVRALFSQYERYNSGWTFESVQMPYTECDSPCYHLSERGFKDQKCCGEYDTPKCMDAIDANQIVELSFNSN